MTKKVEAILEQMDDAMASSALSVAEHLRTVASNGGEQAATAYLIEEAEALIDWSNHFIREAKKTLKK